jgi:hypothetical protein
MVVIEIAPNANCEEVDLRVFNALDAPRTVRQVRLEREPGRPAWYEVIGWTVAGSVCPAVAQKVDDSGDGVAVLLRGGDAGLRLRPARQTSPWGFEDPSQWGEPFLIVASSEDVR